jgi:hypothetical protein
MGVVVQELMHNLARVSQIRHARNQGASKSLQSCGMISIYNLIIHKGMYIYFFISIKECLYDLPCMCFDFHI